MKKTLSVDNKWRGFCGYRGSGQITGVVRIDPFSRDVRITVSQRYFGRWKRIPLVVVLPKLDVKTKRLHIRNKFATSVVYWRRRNPMMKSESTWRSVWKSWIWSSLFTIDVILRCMWAIIATNLWKITNPIKQYVKEKSADCSQVSRRRWSCFVHATS